MQDRGQGAIARRSFGPRHISKGQTHREQKTGLDHYPLVPLQISTLLNILQLSHKPPVQTHLHTHKNCNSASRPPPHVSILVHLRF